ncbi:MAG: hypothetical protein LVS60_00060 [Nodosilinea sp. LVE1205-7]|jgi:hypothetical protein
MEPIASNLAMHQGVASRQITYRLLLTSLWATLLLLAVEAIGDGRTIPSPCWQNLSIPWWMGLAPS